MVHVLAWAVVPFLILLVSQDHHSKTWCTVPRFLCVMVLLELEDIKSSPLFWVITMKKLLLIVVFIVACSLDTIAQRYMEEGGQELNLSAQVEKSFDNLKKGDKVTFTKMVVIRNDRYSDDIYLWSGENIKNKYIFKDVINNCKFEYNNLQQFWDTQVLVNVMPNRSIYGYQSELRSELEEEAISYIYQMKSNGSEFKDPYLESYIYTLVNKISPCYLIDDRPVNLNLLLLNDPSMNACCFPNGTIVLNTGLLAQLHSEDELAAVLSHEIAHFVMDHTIVNIFKEIERQERAQFWAGVATALAAAAEIAISANNDYYVPGGLTAGVAFASFNITNSVIKRLGMEYNKEQESAADATAVEVLKLLGYDENAMSTVLGRMYESYKADHYYYMINLQSTTHPSLASRIEKSGKANLNHVNVDFEKQVSFAVTNAALQKYYYRRFSQVIPLVNQNIKNNVATAEDYILKANCLLSTSNTSESNNEVYALINKAKSIEPNNINIYKAEIIAMLRLGKNQEAVNMLEDYITNLDLLLKGCENTTERIYNNTFSFVSHEQDWAKKMIIKLK